MKTFDVNGDGVLQFEEFAVMWAPTQQALQGSSDAEAGQSEKKGGKDAHVQLPPKPAQPIVAEHLVDHRPLPIGATQPILGAVECAGDDRTHLRAGGQRVSGPRGRGGWGARLASSRA